MSAWVIDWSGAKVCASCGLHEGRGHRYTCEYFPNGQTEAERTQSLIASLRTELTACRAERDAMEQRKDEAYLERNRVVALVARMAISLGCKAGIRKTAIEGWSEDWHGCVFMELPTGQASWHYHDSHAFLFEGLPSYEGEWDGHSTPEKYERLTAYQSTESAQACAERDELRELVDAKLPCDVMVPRRSIFGRGVPIRTLLESLKRRAQWADRFDVENRLMTKTDIEVRAHEAEARAKLLEDAIRDEAIPAINDACIATAIYGDQPPQMYLDAIDKLSKALQSREGEV